MLNTANWQWDGSRDMRQAMATGQFLVCQACGEGGVFKYDHWHGLLLLGCQRTNNKSALFDNAANLHE